MNIRRTNPYVSCIKIRGVPIIAPLMTEDLRVEMKYYKHLAMAVEERLKKLEAAAAAESLSPFPCATPEDSVSLTEESSNCEAAKSLEKNEKSTKTAVDVPTKEVSTKENSKAASDNPDSSLAETAGAMSWKSFSDEETSCRNESSSDVITASTDINRYLNGKSPSKIDAIGSATDKSADSRKPEVPKTLDIVPITVDAPAVNKTATPPEKMEKSESSRENSQSHSTPDSDDARKLVRQGSYILETPSPMLLAHLQEEMANYVPSNGAMKRREWNLSEAKSEWELHKKNDNFVVASPARGIASNRTRRNSASSVSSHRTNRCATQSRGGKYLVGSQQVARSMDCIQSMLSKESISRNMKSANRVNGQREGSKSYVNGASNLKNTKSISILNLANKMGGSLGSLSVAGIRSGKRTPKKSPGNRSSKSFDSCEPVGMARSEGIRGSTQKLLSAVTSDKLVHVFQEIQNTHERQMTELIARQRKEQDIMQREFEKQQLLLLAQIEQTFPGISLRRLVERVSPAPHSPVVRREKARRSVPSPTKIVSASKSVEVNGSRSPRNHKINKCPLDDIYPREDFGESSAYHIKRSQSTRTYVIEQQKSPPIGLYSTSVLNGERRNSGVSRQLFPLEGRTRHVPVPNRSIYEELHVKAATVITAYARGYLVRRLLRTDRVIALKTTYKEALHCMLKLHVDAPLALPELNFHQRLQLQCDAASMNIVELFAQDPSTRMEIIRQDRQIKRARQERPNSARSYSFATQRTLARKKLKEMGDFHTPGSSRSSTLRSRCQTWASNAREKRSPSLLNQGIKRSTSAGAVRKPWR